MLMLLRHGQFDADLEEEMRLHQELREQEQVECGVSPEEAHYAARRRFGNKLVLREESRDMWGWNWVETLLQDIRYGLRQLRRNPGFTAVAVLTLALGIGANTAVFSVIDAVILKLLPVESPRQLVLAQCPDVHGGYYAFSYPAYVYLRDHNNVFSGTFAFSELERLDVAIDGRPELTGGQIVSGSYYSTLGVNAILGRTITPTDDKTPGQSAVAVISYACWNRRFGLSRDVVGKAITVDGIPFTIIGVTPPEFFGLMVGGDPDITVPMMMQAQVMAGVSLLKDKSTWWLDVVGGRLKPGVSEAQARANLDLLFQRALGSKGKDELRIELVPGDRGIAFLRDRLSQPLVILMAAVGLVLLIACANVANLLLARATARQKEITVRLALGAGRLRLIRQLLTESLLLAAAGGALGLLLAFWGSQFLLALISSGPFPISIDLRFDAGIFEFAAAVSLLTGVLFGIAPAFRATRIDLTPQLKASSRAAVTHRRSFGLSRTLVISQVALSLLLLIGAALFVRTLWNLKNLSPGFNPDNMLLFSMEPTLLGYKGARLENFYKEVLDRVESVPGVRSASVARCSEFTPCRAERKISLPGYIPRNDEDASVQMNLVGPRFFETTGMPLLLGRDFTSQDSQSAPRVAVINETMARHYFGASNPLGQRFSLSGASGQIEIVGVVRDAKYHSLREPTPRMAFVPFVQAPPSSLERMTFEIRAAGNPTRVTAAIRQVVWSMEKDLPLYGVKTVAEQVNESLMPERLVATLSTLFGLLALVLACVGLYGIMAYTVTGRTNEIGIRMALGARPTDVLKLVIGSALKLTLIGVMVGAGWALALTRFLSSLLYGVTSSNLLTYAVVSAILTSVALLASYIPARRATRVDPMVALRYE
jgi:macrolide transport system ATP-binding/permease protein